MDIASVIDSGGIAVTGHQSVDCGTIRMDIASVIASGGIAVTGHQSGDCGAIRMDIDLVIVVCGCTVTGHQSVDCGIMDIDLGDVVAQLVEHRPRDPMDSKTRGSNPVWSTSKICESFSESKRLC